MNRREFSALLRKRAIAVVIGAAIVPLMVSGCASSPARDTSAPLRFVLVRHAEKATDDPKDPNLSDAGWFRAARLAESFADAPLRAAYSTNYRRTRLTAAMVASAHDLRVTLYDAAIPAAAFAEQLRATHTGGTVLVVGHSNTIPALAAALCACPVEPIGEHEYDRRIEIRYGADGRAQLQTLRY